MKTSIAFSFLVLIILLDKTTSTIFDSFNIRTENATFYQLENHIPSVIKISLNNTAHESTISMNNTESSCSSLVKDMDSLTQEQFVAILIDECRYDRHTRPNSNEPLNISIQMDIKQIDTSEHQQYRMNVLLNFRYSDHRLKYDTLSPKRRLIVGEKILKSKIWIPHLLLTNEKQNQVNGIEEKDIFITINPLGEVTFSCRMTAVVYCWMNLKKFPFDKQRCTLSFRSWTYNSSNIVLNWDNNNPIQMGNELHLTQFRLVQYFTYTSIVEEPSFEVQSNYSLATFEFVLTREIGYYMLDYFIPSCLLVAATWGTFWLQADNAPARTALGTSPMLAFITLAQGQNRSLPKVSYIKASDIWFLMCAVFIFASMAEFFFVNVIWRRKKHIDVKKVNSKYILKSTLTPRSARKEMETFNFSNNGSANKETVALYATYMTSLDIGNDRSQTPSQLSQTDDEIDTHSVSIPIPTIDYEQKQTQKIHQWTTMTPQEVSIYIDKRSRIVFPCAFVICNIFYWSFVYVF